MKERRKTPRKNRSAPQTTVKKLEQPKKPMINGTLVQVTPGEDKTSFERHNRLLSMEYTRPKKNEAIVKELMKVSYAMRRNDILENGHTFIITERYPFLGQPEHVRYNTQSQACIMCNNMHCT